MSVRHAIQIIPFRARHLREIVPEMDNDLMELAKVAEQAGHAFTACLLGNPIGAAGITLTSNNTGQAWTFFSPLIKSMPKLLFKTVKDKLDEVIVETRLNKIYAVTTINDPIAQRFMKHLGFPPPTQYLYERKILWPS